jgi:CRP-like cAMP-binding protein
MSAAFDGVCSDLGLSNKTENAREVVAKRVIELSNGGARDAGALREAVLASFKRRPPAPANRSARGAAAAGSEPGAAHPHDNVVLAGLPQSDLALLAPHLRVVTVAPGSAQSTELAPGCVYFPHHGMVSLLATTPEGASIEIASAGREGAAWTFIDADLHEGLLVTLAPLTASWIAVDGLRRILSASAALRRAIAACRGVLLVQLRQNLVCTGLHVADRRLARWLLEAADRHRCDVIPATQESVALRLGIRRTTVTLLASKLQEAGAIRWTRSRVEIRDRARLESAACSCYAALRARMSSALAIDTTISREDFGT